MTYPLGTGEDELAGRALRVPAILGLSGDGEAAESNTRIDDTCFEDVGVCTCEHAGHHGTGIRADGEDTVRVDTPVADGETSGIRDTERVAASIVRERLVRGDVPASTGVRLYDTVER